MTYQEVLNILLSKKPINVLVCDVYDDSPIVSYGTVTIANDKTLYILYPTTQGYRREISWNNEDRIADANAS